MTLNLTFEKRKHAFEELGKYLLNPDESLKNLIYSSHFHNAWFTPEETDRAVKGLGEMLRGEDLRQWLPKSLPADQKLVGLVLAGNIPMVGFHDILSVLATGHVALIKQSSQDQKLIPYVLEKLVEIEPLFSAQIQYVERLQNFDAVIATGSNNSSRYFEHYFSKVPHIIRKNRNSAAVLTGAETREMLRELGKDLFSYFGLGCRNVSKLYVPENYDFTAFFESIEEYKEVGNHHKYNNNYDYNKSIYLINSVKHFDNGFLLLKEDTQIASPLAVCYYEEYKDLKSLEAQLVNLSDQLQCVVAAHPLSIKTQLVSFGESQKPRLWDYADRVNTVDFLLSL